MPMQPFCLDPNNIGKYGLIKSNNKNKQQMLVTSSAPQKNWLKRLGFTLKQYLTSWIKLHSLVIPEHFRTQILSWTYTLYLSLNESLKFLSIFRKIISLIISNHLVSQLSFPRYFPATFLFSSLLFSKLPVVLMLYPDYSQISSSLIKVFWNIIFIAGVEEFRFMSAKVKRQVMLISWTVT